MNAICHTDGYQDQKDAPTNQIVVGIGEKDEEIELVR